MAEEEQVAFDNWEEEAEGEEAAFGNWEEEAEKAEYEPAQKEVKNQ